MKLREWCLLGVAALMLLAGSAQTAAAPFAQMDVVAGTASCTFDINGGTAVTVTPTGTTCKVDVGAVAVGPFTVNGTAKGPPDPVWGATPSAVLSKPFTRPGPWATGLSITLVP